jgi:hypothetical protein
MLKVRKRRTLFRRKVRYTPSFAVFIAGLKKNFKKTGANRGVKVLSHRLFVNLIKKSRGIRIRAPSLYSRIQLFKKYHFRKRLPALSYLKTVFLIRQLRS